MISFLNTRTPRLSIRENQFLGAVCVNRFCEEFTIQEVIDYVNHLASILTSKDLLEWERKGGYLVVTGRGEPIPENIMNAIPEEKRNDFLNIIEFSSEIGIVDLYGGYSKYPSIFLDKCFVILKKFDIEVPDKTILDGLERGQDNFGRVYTKEEKFEICKKLNVTF